MASLMMYKFSNLGIFDSFYSLALTLHQLVSLKLVFQAIYS